MNTRVVLSIVGLTSAVAVGWLGVWAWNAWPPLARYRMGRNHAAMRAITARYLAGLIPLDSAAADLGRRMNRNMDLGWALQDSGPPGSATLTSLNRIVAPNGTAPDDPRINELLERAFAAFMGPDGYARSQARLKELRDSFGGQSPSRGP